MKRKTKAAPEPSPAGRKSSVYLSALQDRQMTVLGVTLAEVVRRGLEAIASEGTSPLVVTLHGDGTYTLVREGGRKPPPVTHPRRVPVDRHYAVPGPQDADPDADPQPEPSPESEDQS
jgi:hypothetical protein